MTAGAGARQSSRSHRPGRIIERPRLIKQLDAAEAPVILIVAPAGYGKTTLARQWAKTLSGVIWVSCTPAHRDVVTFAEDVAAGIDALGGNASRFVAEYVLARSNPQRAAREIGNVLANKLTEVPARWLVIDDYHELAESPEVEALVRVVRERIKARVLISTRTRPDWIRTRHLLYAEAVEVGRSDLALTPDETAQILGRRPDLDRLIRMADGWPAVVGLASALEKVDPPDFASTALHRYVADELFEAVSPPTQQQLIDLALLPDLSTEQLRSRFGSDASAVVATAAELGFITSPERPELHPLLRDFLLTKLATSGDTMRVHDAVRIALDSHQWQSALDLVVRFNLVELSDEVLQASFSSLVRSGRLETLRTFAEATRSDPRFPRSSIEVIDAEVAMRNGNFSLAASLARRASAELPPGHQLRSHALIVAGRANFFLGQYRESVDAYSAAGAAANDDTDRLDSTFGLIATQTYAELGDAQRVVSELRKLRTTSPTALVRHATSELNLRRFSGFAVEAPIEDALHVLPSVPDPHVRTAFTYTAAYLLGVRGEYIRAEEFLELCARDVVDFELDFVRPFLDWTQAFIDLGLRRFGAADGHLQRVEDAVAERHHESHDLNARMLRARLMLQTGEAEQASELLEFPAASTALPSWRAELVSTRALALACTGKMSDAIVAADEAVTLTRFVEVHVLAQAARAVAYSQSATRDDAARSLFRDASRLDVWDPVVCALRSSEALTRNVAADRTLRPLLTQVIRRVGDASLARRVGLRARSPHAPESLLSDRELEVIGLMARGMRNKEIAAALYVAESTIKVHVRHILEKLGVASRAAAVARWERSAGR